MKIVLKKLSLTLLLAISISSAKANLPGNYNITEKERKEAILQYNTANAAWWGFNKIDSTYAIKSAINSGAAKVIIPYIGIDWIITPLSLRSNLELTIENGVVVSAKKGDFHNTGDCMFKAKNCSNIKIIGYGAIIKMQKDDYVSSDYKHGQWRTGINLSGCNNITISGLEIKETGGDGIYIGPGKLLTPSSNIFVSDCKFYNNYRQGISVISVNKLRIDNCIFQNTQGQSPEGGIDLEPNSETDQLNNIVISNCQSIGNAGAGYIVSVLNLTEKTDPISILFYNCLSDGCKYGLMVFSNKINGPSGLIEFRNCSITKTIGPGIWIETDNEKFSLKFNQCTLNETCIETIRSSKRFFTPIFIKTKNDLNQDKFIEFINCYIRDNEPRPKIKYESDKLKKTNIFGTIFLHENNSGSVLSEPFLEMLNFNIIK